VKRNGKKHGTVPGLAEPESELTKLSLTHKHGVNSKKQTKNWDLGFGIRGLGWF